MKELAIHHFPASQDQPARVQVSYRAEEGAQPQQHEAAFEFAMTEEQRKLIQWYLEEYLVYPWGIFRDRAARAEQMMADLGKQLFEAVFCSRSIQRLYGSVADDFPNTRFVIHASDPQGIAIPWELLRDPDLGDYGLLSRLAYSFTRCQSDLVANRAALPDQTTFNILMVISRPRGPERDVPFQSVARPLLELFREHGDRIHLDILRPPTFEQLERVLSEKPNFYHVVHFDGHGAFQAGAASSSPNFYGETGEQGTLIFEGENGQSNAVTGTELGALLARSAVPVVVLNACQSGMTRPESLYPSVGNQILKAGARGVVAMAYSVYVQTAVRFMARLYQELVNGRELGRAVTLAREELVAHPQRSSPVGEIDLQDWLVPLLFQAAPVIPLRRQAAAEEVTLSLGGVQDQQARAGTEIDCPEPPAYGFVGRDSAILTLERAFQNETVVLLQGMAGIGKTETAVGFARWLAETNALDGPIFFFKFEQYLPLAQVCDRIGQVFHPMLKRQGIEWQLLDGELRRDVALQILTRIPCLLIWDNFEPVAGFPSGTPSAWTAGEQQELRDFLAALRGGRSKVLLTSRRDEPWLGSIYRRVELTGLTLVEAQELALRVLLRAGFEAQQIAALPDYNVLLRHLRGNPLAIQVTLPELRRQSPQALLQALQAGEANLSSDDPSLGRERSLAASLTYRLDALDTTLHQRLGLLGLFQGFVDADVLALLCGQEGAPGLIAGMDRAAWVAVLDAAAEVGLLRSLGGGYYHMHPALPWFFHDLLQETFPQQADWLEGAFCTTYGDYFYYLDDLFKERAELAQSLLNAEEPNALAALRLARRRKDWVAIENILYGMNRLMDVQGRWTEWRRLVAEIYGDTIDEQGEALAGCESLWIALLGHQASLAQYRRDFVSAEQVILRLKAHYERVGDEKNTAVVLHQLGMIAQERRQFDEAEQCYRQSLAIKERIKDEHGQASTLHNLGAIAQERRQFDEAEQCYRQSLAIEERIHNEHGQAITLHQLGIIAQARRQFDEAEQWYRQSLAIEERIHNEHGQAGSLHQLGRIAEERRQLDEAEQWYRQSLAIRERIHDEYGQAQTLHQLGNVSYLRRQFDEAEQWYRQSLAIKERIHDEHGQAITLHQLGAIAQERRQFDEAEHWYRQSLAIEERIHDEYGQAGTLHQLGRIAQEQRQFDEAEQWYRQSLAIRERIHDEHGQANSLHQLGRVAEEHGNSEEALAFYKQAEAIIARLNDLHNLGIVRRSIQRVTGTDQENEQA